LTLTNQIAVSSVCQPSLSCLGWLAVKNYA